MDAVARSIEPVAPADAAKSDTAKSRRGHGRNGADDLPGALHVQVRLDGLLPGAMCPAHGFPFHRLAQMQDHLDVPLAASTQWDIVALASASYLPVYEELIRQAAQGELVSNDDTTAKILAWMGRRRAKTVAAAVDANAAVANATAVETIIPDLDRTGLYTTGVVAECGAHRIALFFTGRRHAGENLEEVLRRRAAELPPPIQMCDALSRNYPDSFQTIVANCLAHARRKFVEVKDNFLAECEYVLGALAQVYAADAHAKEERLTPEQRLRHHQEKSGPVMTLLHEWLKQQIEQRQTEPNSALGASIEYLRRHWTKLTLFLRVPGAPLDNNVVERALKKAILHRKNSLFYKTERGAKVGDIHMT
ncbi:MAG: IS66 family transposase, partial [Acidobacteria bacterium]|nr:IS66 family transposase [Acidobacteriota bacterium]